MTESYPPATVSAGIRSASKATIRHFERVGIVDDPRTAEALRGKQAVAVSADRTWTIRHARPEDGRPVRRFVFDILNEYHVAADPDDSDADVMEFGAARGRARRAPRRGGRRRADRLGDPHALRRRRDQAVEALPQAGVPRHRPRAATCSRARRRRRRSAATAGSACGTRALYVEAVRLYERAGWTRGPDQPPPGPGPALLPRPLKTSGTFTKRV